MMIISSGVQITPAEGCVLLSEWRRAGRSHGFWIGSTRIGLITISGRPRELGRYRWSAAGKKGRSNTLAAAKNAVTKAIKGPKPK